MRIDELLTAQGKKQTDLINYLRMARGTYVHWKTQKNKSYMKHLDEIADYFGVPLYYLGFPSKLSKQLLIEKMPLNACLKIAEIEAL